MVVILTMLSIGQTIVMIAGGIDLSVGAMVKLIGEHGADGVGLTVNLLERLQKGEPMSSEDISSLGLRASSDLLSAMQEAEAEDRKAAVDFATKIGSVLGPLLKAIVVALI